MLLALSIATFAATAAPPAPTAGAPVAAPAEVATDAQVAVEVIAIAQCTRQPSSTGPVPPSHAEPLARALQQRVQQGQLVAQPLMLTRVGTPAHVSMGRRSAEGEVDADFEVAVDPRVLDDGAVQLRITATVHDLSAHIAYPLRSGWGWVLRLDQAPDLRCRGRQRAETLAYVQPHVLDADTSLDSLRDRGSRSPVPDTDDDLLTDVLDSLPSLL